MCPVKKETGITAAAAVARETVPAPESDQKKIRMYFDLFVFCLCTVRETVPETESNKKK